MSPEAEMGWMFAITLALILGGILAWAGACALIQ